MLFGAPFRGTGGRCLRAIFLKDERSSKSKGMSKKKSKKKKVVAPKKGKQKPLSSPRKKNWLTPTILAVLAMLLYAPSINYDFVYDDDAVLKDNRFVKQGFGGLGKIWTTSYFKGFNENINARAFRPIPLTMFAVENQFFGLNPKVHHGVGVFLFGLTAFFLFLFLSRLLRKHHKLLPLIAAALFIVHPIHIEVVANIKSRDELTAFLCFMIAGWLLLKSIDQKKFLYQILSLVFFTIALFSKESALTTLAVIPLMLWFFRDLDLKSVGLKTFPYFGLAIVYLIIRSSVVGGLNEGVTLTVLDNSLLAAETVSERIATNIYVLGIYFFKNLFPHPLLSDYSFNTIPIVGWGDYKVWLSILLYVGLIGATIYGLLKKKVYSFAILYFFITVSIFSSVIVLNVNAYADRFNYNPSLGVCILLAWGLTFLFKLQNNKATRLPLEGDADRQREEFYSLGFATSSFGNWGTKQNTIGILLTAAILLAGISKTTAHLPVWENRYSLFEYDATNAPNNARMLKNHGGSLARQALAATDQNERTRLAQESVQYLEKALSIYDRISTGHIHLGNMYGLLGDYDKAGTAFEKGLAIDSKSYSGNTNLANVYYRKGRYQEALDLMQKVNQKRFSKNDHYLISLIYGKLGQSDLAGKHRGLSGR